MTILEELEDGKKDDKKKGKDKKADKKDDKKDKKADKKDKKGGDKKGDKKSDKKKDKKKDEPKDESKDKGDEESGSKEKSKESPKKTVKLPPDDAPIDIQVQVENIPVPKEPPRLDTIKLELKAPIFKTGGPKDKLLETATDSEEPEEDDGPPKYAKVPYTEERYRHSLQSKDGRDYLLEGRRIKYQLNHGRPAAKSSSVQIMAPTEKVVWNVRPDGTIAAALDLLGTARKGSVKKKDSKTSLSKSASKTSLSRGRSGSKEGDLKGVLSADTQILPGGVRYSRKEFNTTDGRTLVAESKFGPTEMSIVVRPKNAIRDTLGDDSLAGQAIQRIENAEDCACESCSGSDHVIGGSRVTSVAQVCTDCNTVMTEELLVEHSTNPAKNKAKPDSPIGKIQIFAPQGLNKVVQEECALEGDHQISRVEIYNDPNVSFSDSSMSSGMAAVPQVAVEAHRRPGVYPAGKMPNKVVKVEPGPDMPPLPVMTPPPKPSSPKDAWKQYQVEYERYIKNLRQWQALQARMANKVQRINVQTNHDGEPFQIRLAIRKDQLKKQRRLQNKKPKLVKQERTVIQKSEYDVPTPWQLRELPPTKAQTTVVQKQMTTSNDDKARLFVPQMQKTTTTTTIVQNEVPAGLPAAEAAANGKPSVMGTRTVVKTRNRDVKPGANQVLSMQTAPPCLLAVSSEEETVVTPVTSMSDHDYFPEGIFDK